MKIVLGIFAILAGIFYFNLSPKKETVKKPVEKKAERAVTEIEAPKVIPPPTKNMALLTKTVEEIPEVKGDIFPTYKGRVVARFFNGKLLPPIKGSTKKLLFSKDPTHPRIEMKAAQFFNSMGFDEDDKMVVERGKSYFLVSGEDALKVEAFKVLYNWNGEPKKEVFLMRSTTGNYYKKLN